MKVAYYSPLPPERSGIADYAALLLPALGRLVDVEVVRRGRTRPVAADVALYHVGNDPEAHGWIVEALRRRPGVVVLHDFVLHHLVAGLTIGHKDGPGYLAAMERDAGVAGRLLAHGVLDGRVAPIWETRPDEFPLAGEVLSHATGLIAHSRYVEQRARESGYHGPLWRIPHPAWPVADVAAAELEGRPLFGCFGHLNASKRIPQLLEAFALVRERHPNARLLLVGPASPRFDAGRLIGEGVERIDYVGEDRLWSLMAACDACIALRAPTMGETSGSVIRALSLGRPLVVSDLGWFSELPAEVALKVPVDEDEVPSLATALELLASSEATQLAMSDAARAYAGDELDLGRVAERYVTALEEAAGGSAVADTVVAEVAQAAAEIGIEPGTPFATELAGHLDELGLARNGRPEPAPPPREGRLARVPVWAWLAALVVVSALFRYGLSRRVVAPWIMVDELIYSELAKSFAATGHFLIRDVHHGAYGAVYPVLISAAWRLFGSVPDAYAAAKTIGSVVMSLTAIPVYFLARRVLTPLPSLVAAALAVAVPSLMYTGTLMTETVFYPVFACVALALVLMLERPTLPRQLTLLALCLLAFLTRTQAIVLVPAVATAPLLLVWLDRRRLRMLADFRALYGILLGAVVAVLVVQLARGHSPYDVLGSYSLTGHTTYRPGQVVKWVLYHLAELDLYLAVAPFAAVLLLTALGRSLDRPLRVFLAATLPLTGWLVLEVAAFASALSPRVEERNLFYVAPLFLIALLAWIERGLPRPPRAAAVAAVVAAALPGVLPYHTLIGASAESDTLALMPLWWLNETVVGLDTIAVVVVVAGALISLLFLSVSPRYALALPVAVFLWFAFTTERVERFDHGFPKASVGALFQGITAPRRDWVDAAVGRHADVAFVFSGKDVHNQPLTLWENEFYNRSIGAVYDLRQPSMGDLPETKVTERRDGVLLANGQPVRHPYVLSEESVPLAGKVVARDVRKGMVLRRTDGVLAIGYRVRGLYPNDTWSGRRVVYTRLRCKGGTVTAELASDVHLFSRPQTVRAAGRSVTFDPADTASLTVPLRQQGGVCRVVFGVLPTAVPGKGDARVLGVHFLGFRYTAP
ncbi:MAG: glycosyltransferase family 4 protein [Actinobacteria bacterium]|nr:MAG: glycosyltransferase family 4 protein [Actinomycetota bacterium]